MSRKATKKQAQRRATHDAQREVTVWRFVRYAQRWGCELRSVQPDLPKYLQWHINAWEGQPGEVLRAINRLRSERDFIWLQGAVVELLTAVTNIEKGYQGYLVTGSYGPMTAVDVGSMLRIQSRRATAVLTRLERVGLLERVPWPPGLPGGENPDSERLRLLHQLDEMCARGPPKPSEKRGSRPQEAASPLKGSKSRSRKAAQGTSVEVEEDAAAPPKPAAFAAWEKGQRARLAGQAPGQTSATPTATPSTRPTSTASTSPDGRAGPTRVTSSGRDAILSASGPPAVVKLTVAQFGKERRYSLEANTFAEQVLASAGFAAERCEWVNEAAHFAKLWEECRQRLTAGACEKVKVKVLSVAARLRSGQIKPDKPMGYLERTMQNEIRDRKRARQVSG